MLPRVFLYNSFLSILLLCSPVQAEWFEERWSDSEGNNYQGTVSPPSSGSSSSYGGGGTYVAPQPSPREIFRQRYQDTKTQGDTLYREGNFDRAVELLYEALQLCRQYGYEDCLDLELLLSSAVTNRDMAESRAARERENRERAARRLAEMQRQREQARLNISAMLNQTAVDFDGTGQGLNLAPMVAMPPPVPGSTPDGPAQAKNGKDPGSGAAHVINLDAPSPAPHGNPNVVNLKTMPSDKPGTVTPKSGTLAPPKQKGMHFIDVPKPEALLPKNPKERLAMKDAATHILDTLKQANGDAGQAMRVMVARIRLLDDPARPEAHEAFSYLMGLYASQMIYGGRASNPFAASQEDSAALLGAVAALDPEHGRAEATDDAASADTALILAQRWRKQWLGSALKKNNGDIEASMKSLQGNTSPGAVYAYRFLEGLVAYKDAAKQGAR